MLELSQLFENNRTWAQEQLEQDEDFFNRLAVGQRPSYLWIGCSDSRVPSNEIVGLPPGELFVHRNIANVVVHTDLNCLSVVQYAVEALGIKHIILCGHTGCGGIRAAMQPQEFGLIDNWLRHIRDVYERYEVELSTIADEDERVNRLSELNVREQMYNLVHSTVVQKAWSRGQQLSVHGWMYDMQSGLLRDLDLCIRNPNEIRKSYRLDLHPVQG